jgi:hypothetical protein
MRAAICARYLTRNKETKRNNMKTLTVQQAQENLDKAWARQQLALDTGNVRKIANAGKKVIDAAYAVKRAQNHAAMDADTAPVSKTLTYGTLPSFESFEAAYGVACNDGYEYTMELNDADCTMFIDTSIDGIGTNLGCQSPNHTKVTFHFTPRELYSLLEALVETHRENKCEVECEWAGDFASSILSTLGFDWS